MDMDTMHSTKACSTLLMSAVCGVKTYFDELPPDWENTRKGSASAYFIRGLKVNEKRVFSSFGGKFEFCKFGILALCWNHKFDEEQSEILGLLVDLGFEETKTYHNKKNGTDCSFFLIGVPDLIKKLKEYDKEGKKI